jgi:hypothetical protein
MTSGIVPVASIGVQFTTRFAIESPTTFDKTTHDPVDPERPHIYIQLMPGKKPAN